ncbi:MAG TPA: hypothetical protein VI112_14180, partial [Bacteroidia bacterium]
MNEFFSKQVVGTNTVEDLVWAGGILLLGILLQLLFTRVIARFIYSFLKKHSHGVPFERLFELVNRPLGWFIVFVAIYFAFDQLSFPHNWKFATPDKVGVRM